MKSKSLLFLSAALIAGVCLLLNTSRESGPTDSSITAVVAGHAQHAGHGHSSADCQAAKPEFPAAKTQRSLNPIFKLTGAQGGLTVPLHAFDVLKGQDVGAELAIQAGELELAGKLTHVSEVGDRGNYIVELNDSTGRLHVAASDHRLVGEVFFYGDSRMLQIREYSMDSLEPVVVVESGRISEFYCVPSGTMYGTSGLMTGSASGLLEPQSSTVSPFEGDPAPYQIESLPGSANVLYLDFDGGVFGQVDSPLLPGVVAAEPHARVNDEAWVRAVHARVAEDFAPFDINVTTTRSVFDAAVTVQRIHVVITPTDDAAPGTGGVVKIGSFGVDESPIVWVFNHTEYAVASTISHEAGHALGLDDDGIADGAEYYGGHNGGYSPGWAPIMGAPWADAEGELLYDEVDQWSSGEYAGASNDENDLLLIAQQLGYVADDFVDSYEDALVGGAGSISGTEINESGNLIRSGAGLISETDDADVFEVEVLYDGLLTLTVAPLDVDAKLFEEMGEASTLGRLETGARTQGANLAVAIELLDATGLRVATGTANGDAGLGSLINEADLDAGTYYLVIDGAGRNSAANGFTDYASLGEYTVQAEMLAGPILVSGSNKGYQPISNGSETIDVQNATDFEFVVNGAPQSNIFQIFNTDLQAVTINSITLANGTDFVVSKAPTTVNAGTGKSFYIYFAPTGSGYLAFDVVTIAYTPLSSGLPATYTFTVGGTAVSAATRDNYEPNDNSLAPAYLTTVEDTWLSAYKGLATLHSVPFQPGGDPRDWYHFTVDGDDDLVTVDINYDATLYDLTFTLRVKQNNTTIPLGSTSAATGQLSYIITGDETVPYTDFYVRVDAADKSVLNSYDLKWNAISLSGDLGEDRYNNSSRETAFDLSGQSGAPLSEVLGRGVLNGEDWYQITVAADRSNAYNRMIYVEAVFNDIEDEAPVNIDIEVFAEMDDGFLGQFDEFFDIINFFPTSSVSTDADKEEVTVATWGWVPLSDSVGEDRIPIANDNVMGVVPGTYFVRVYSPDAYTGSTYDLTVGTLIEDNYEIIDDQGTENDSRDDAFDLGETIIDTWLHHVAGPGTLANYQSDPATPGDTFINRGDRDWYQFSLPRGETVNQFSVEYEYLAESGFLAVYDADGTELVIADADAGVLTVDNPSGSTYYIQVSSIDREIANLSGYDFRVTVSALPPANDVEDDPFEDNDNYTQPYPLTALEGLSLASLGSYGVQLDPDWYLIQVPAGATQLQIDCLFDSSEGDLDIRLWKDWGGALSILSEDIPNGKRILWNDEDSLALAAGNYLIEVSGDDLGNLYNISWDVDRADDNYEQNDDFASAHPLTATPRQWLNKVNGLGIQQDEDYYRIEVFEAAGTAELQIRTFFDPSQGDIDMELYYVEGPGEYAWVDSSENLDTVEELTISNPRVGEYIIRLYFGDQGNEYDLWWAPFTQSEVDAIDLANDRYENNDTLGTAFPLGGDEVILAGIFGQGTQSDDDWYAITVSDNNIGLDIECEFQPQNGDIDIELYDAFGGLLGRSAADEGPTGPFDTAFEKIGFGASLPEGTYFIRVYGANLGNPYNLYWVERSPDDFEPNNSLETAFDLGREAPDELAAVELPILQVEGTQSNDDWFEIEVVSDTGFLSVDLEYVHFFGNIDFEIYDAAGAPFWSPPVAPDENRPEVDALLDPFVESTFIAVTAGTYYIKVFGGPATTYTEEIPAFDTPGGNRWNSYTLNWAVVQDDAYEFDREDVVLIENDDAVSVLGDPSHPSNLSGQDGVVIEALQYDDDWYQVTLDVGNQVLAVRIEYDHANSDIDLEIYDAAGVLLAGPKAGERDPADITDEEPATKEDNGESFVYFAPDNSGGEYFFRVYGDGNQNSSYELVWTQALGDDELEDNNDLGSASPILEDLIYDNPVSRRSAPFDAFPSDPDLTRAFQFDDDWYRIEKEDREVQLGVKLNFNSAKGDLAFAIYDALGNELLLTDGDIDDEFRIAWPSPEAGDYYVKVFGDNLGNDYTIQWATSFVDIYESSTGNNLIDHATDLLGQEALRMSEGLGYATSGDEDWYQIEIAAGDDGVIVEAFREFASDDGFAMELFNSNDQSVAFATPAPNDDPAPTIQRIRYTGPAGTYYVRVSGGLMGNPYDLFWQSYNEDVLELAADEFAIRTRANIQNDSPDLPRALQFTRVNDPFFPGVDGPSVDLELVLLENLTQADADWYWIDADGEGRLIIDLQFEHQKGDIDMALYEGANGRIAPGADAINVLDGNGSLQGISNTDNERIDLNLAELGLQTIGPYLLVVYGHGVEAPEKLTDIGDVNDASTYVRAIDPSVDDTTGLGNTYSLRWSSEVDDEFDVTLPDAPTAPSSASPTFFDDYLEFQDSYEELFSAIQILSNFSEVSGVPVALELPDPVDPFFVADYDAFKADYDTRFVPLYAPFKVTYDAVDLEVNDGIDIANGIDRSADLGTLWDLVLPQTVIAPIPSDYSDTASFLADYELFLLEYVNLPLYLDLVRVLPDLDAAPGMSYLDTNRLDAPVAPLFEDYGSEADFLADYAVFLADYGLFLVDYEDFKLEFEIHRLALENLTLPVAPSEPFLADAPFLPWEPAAPVHGDFDTDEDFLVALDDFSEEYGEYVIEQQAFDDEYASFKSSYDAFQTDYATTRTNLISEYDTFKLAYDDFVFDWNEYQEFIGNFSGMTLDIPAVPDSIDADLPLAPAPDVPELADLATALTVPPTLPDPEDFGSTADFLLAYDTFLTDYATHEADNTTFNGDYFAAVFFDLPSYGDFRDDLLDPYDDLWEYENFSADALLLTETRELVVFRMNQFDEDWYKIQIPSDTVHELYARIDFEHVEGDLTLSLYSENGNLVLQSATTADREIVNIFGSGNGTYYLQVTGEDIGTSYSLYLRNYRDDIYEEVDGTQNDDFDGASDIRFLQDVKVVNVQNPEPGQLAPHFEYGELQGVQWDDDYYIIAVPKDMVHLDAAAYTGLQGDDDIGFTIHNVDQDEMRWANEPGWYSIIPPEASLYYIRVFGSDVGSPYTLSWRIDNIDNYDDNYGAFYDDGLDRGVQFRDNNDWQRAYNLTQPTRLAPVYNRRTNYVDPIRDLRYDEALFQARFNSGGNNTRDLAVGHGTQLDDDWFRIQIPSWELVTARQGNRNIQVLKRIYNVQLNVDLQYTHADGNIDVEVYDEDDLAAFGLSGSEPLSAFSLETDEDENQEYFTVPIDPLDEDHVYYIRVYGDNLGNSYELVWEESRDDAYELNSFVDLAHDLTLAYDAVTDDDGDEPRQADEWSLVGGEPTDFISSEGKWLHEMWQFTDVDGDGNIDPEMHTDDSDLGNGDGIANFGEAYSPSETQLRGYGNQSTDDWYAIAVSAGSSTLDVQANFWADDNTDHTYAPDDLDFAIDLYRLVEDTVLGIRKPILIGRINDNDRNAEPFPRRPHPIGGDLDYPLTEPGDAIDPDTGERIEGGAITLPDTDGGIYFIRIFRDNRRHPYTFKWDDGVVDNAGDLVNIDDYLNGDWSYIPNLELPEDILNPGAGDENDNGYPDWFEVALVLNPEDYAIPDETEAESDLRDAVVGMIRTVDANGVEDEYYTVTYLRSTEAVALGFEFTVQQKQNLADPEWEAALAEQEVSVEIVAPGIERVVYRAPVPTDEEPMYYFRVSVTEPATP